MNVKELIAELENLPQDMDVFQSKDGEGNGFRPVEEAAISDFLLEEREAVHPDDVGTEFDSADLTKVVIIWPSY